MKILAGPKTLAGYLTGFLVGAFIAAAGFATAQDIDVGARGLAASRLAVVAGVAAGPAGSDFTLQAPTSFSLKLVGNGAGASHTIVWNGATLQLPSAALLSFNGDTNLQRDAANIMALRNGTTAQAFRAYNTFTDASNGEWATFDWTTTANTLTIGPKANGTGTVRSVAALGAWNFSGAITTANNIQAGANSDIGWAGGAQLQGMGDGAFLPTKNNGTQNTVTSLNSGSTCVSAHDGARSFVTDATTTTFASAVTGGGSNHVPVYCDGSGTPAWKIGRADLSPANDNLAPGLRQQADRLWSAFG